VLLKIKVHALDFAYLRTSYFGFFMRRLLSILSRRQFVPFSIRNTLASVAKSSHEKDYEGVILPYMNVSKGKCFVDVGAHVGKHTKKMALKGIIVYAFEPNPNVFEILRENVKDFPNVKVFKIALGDRRAEAVFYIYKENPSSGFGSLYNLYERKNVEELVVNVRTLDSFAFHNVGLIKVDTEGAEYNILKGAIKTLRRETPRLILEIHSPLYLNMRLITSLLSCLGYENIKQVCKANRDQIFIVADKGEEN
jgi:FkbM family methyltransferase